MQLSKPPYPLDKDAVHEVNTALISLVSLYFLSAADGSEPKWGKVIADRGNLVVLEVHEFDSDRVHINMVDGAFCRGFDRDDSVCFYRTLDELKAEIDRRNREYANYEQAQLLLRDCKDCD